MTSEVFLEGQAISAPEMDVVLLRAPVGTVAQKPNLFPKSIYTSVAYGPHIHGLVSSRAELDALVERALRGAALWEEKGRTACANPAPLCPAGSCSGCASPAHRHPP